jgi:indole-3-acetate monooxygenase
MRAGAGSSRCFTDVMTESKAGRGWIREVDPLPRMEVLEALARADASVAWCVEIGSGTAYMLSGWLQPDIAREIPCADAHTVVSGAVAVPGGRATAVDGGYRVTGRWG